MSSDGTAATALAPGFRFHPTDEELVSYYLKRKVFGKPFRVDAISELDLYKSEPWDLPGRSRIQSRDMEWYFFSPLDKKYANRSRTSRTTGQGYWKTTGKDRAVRRGARVVGRKKTLVFHVGKAPKGQRTNWVMHEYRLEDEEIVKCGMSQDGYVVCRIFQKNGAGPQNGAQYGAPFVEEEWDEDEGVVHMRHGVEGITVDFGDNLFMQLDDLEHECKVVDIQQENGIPRLGCNDGKNACNNILDKEGSSSSLTQGDDNQDLINFVDHEVRMPEMLDDQGVVGFDDVDLPEIHQTQELPGDDYLELNDFADILDADFFSIKDSVTCNTTAQTTKESTGLLPELQIEEKNAYFPEQVLMQMTPSVAENSDVRLEDKVCPVVADYLSDHQADDCIMYFDAPENPAGHGSFTEMNEFIYPAISMPSKPDPVDELITYFDATEDKLLYSGLENSVILDSCNLVEFPFASEINKDGTQAQETSHLDPNTSSGEVEGDNSCSKATDTYVVPGDHYDNGWDKTFKKHLIGMLGSISSPPALAAECPIKGAESLKLSPANHSSSSIRVTAGVIHLDGVVVSSRAKHWPLQKVEDMHGLSCGCPADDVICSLEAFESVGKVQSGIMPWLIRCGLCLFSLYFLLRAVSYKIGFLYL